MVSLIHALKKSILALVTPAKTFLGNFFNLLFNFIDAHVSLMEEALEGF
jgi:hypothetical protein